MAPTAQHNGNSTASLEVKHNENKNDDNENPKGITADLFEATLKKTEPKYLKIKSFEAKPAVAAGENFATVIFRININAELNDGTTETFQYMMKLPQDNQHFKDMMRKHNIFEIERRMYSEFVPEFKQMYHEYGVEVNFSAKFHNIESSAEFGTILMEDLQPRGYRNANRIEGLDIEHTHAVLERLAQWHAASAVRVDTKGLYPELFNKGLYYKSDAMELIINTNIETMFDSIKSLKGMEQHNEIVKNALDNMCSDMTRLSVYDPNEFNVLNHGDCWSNNIMFKYDNEGKLEDTLLIDYQMINYGSPAKDLVYFLISSPAYNVKVKHYDSFVKFYHDNLVKNLKLLKYKKKLPTLRDIHIAMLKNGVWGVFSCLGIMPLSLLDSNNDANIDSFLNETNAANQFRIRLYTNPRYLKQIDMIMPWMCNRGFFET